MMKKILKILIIGVFLTGFIASVTCLFYSPRIAMPSCHNKTPMRSTEDNSCLSHCLKQKVLAINVGGQLSNELKSKGGFFVRSPVPLNLQSITISLKIDSTRYINQLMSKLNSGQIFLNLSFNHSPPPLL